MKGIVNFILCGIMLGVAINSIEYLIPLVIFGLINLLWGVFLEAKEVDEQ